MFITIVYPISDLRHLLDDDNLFYDYLNKIPIEENQYYFKKIGFNKKRKRGPVEHLEIEDFYFDASKFINTSLTQNKPIFKNIKVKYEFRRLFYQKNKPSRIEIGIRFINFSKYNLQVNFERFLELLKNIEIQTKNISNNFIKKDIKTKGSLTSTKYAILNIICYSTLLRNNKIESHNYLFKHKKFVKVFNPLIIIDFKNHVYNKLPKHKINLRLTYNFNFGVYYYNKIYSDQSIDFFLMERKKGLHKNDMPQFRDTRLRLINFYSSFKYSIFLINTIGNNNLSLFDYEKIKSNIRCFQYLFNSPISDFDSKLINFYNSNLVGFSKVKNSLLKFDNKNNPNIKHRIFISYAHKSSVYVDEMVKYLKNNIEIDYWRDIDRVNAGDNWIDEINIGIKNCNIGILMLCQDFFCSDTVRELELPALLSLSKKRKIKLITILCEDCNYEDFIGLNEIQMANSPSNKLSNIHKDGTYKSFYKNLVKSIRKS